MIHKSKSPFGQRVYLLTDQMIEVSGTFPMKGRFQAKVPYTDLRPIVDRLWLRGPYLNLGMWFAALGLGVYLVETAFVGMDGLSGACLFTFMWAVVGFVLMLIGLPKFQIARFKTKTGIAALDIIEAGPAKDGFEAFVDEIARRVANASEPKAAQPGATDNPDDAQRIRED